jgi:hypothetical protein
VRENRVQVQLRFVLEQQCRELAELLKSKVPAGVGFTLFLSDYGEGGNVAYVSTIDRHDSIRLVREWLDRADPHARVPENDLLRRENSELREKARRAHALLHSIEGGDGEPTADEMERIAQLNALLGDMAK